jgi:outer membrane lipoprotein-sorting protein
MTRSLPKLLIHVTAAVLVLAGAAVAIASRSSADTPPPAKPLAEALHDAMTAPAPPGVSGRIAFRNNLVDSAAVPGGDASPLLSGAEGRFWLAADGRARLELQSPAGDAQVQLDGDRISLYDPASNTLYRAKLPGGVGAATGDGGELPGAGGIQLALSRLARTVELSEARPGTVAGKAAYTVRVAPRHDGGLVGAAELAWDAAHGTPLRAAVYAQGEREPVLELEATDVSFDPVAARDVAPATPAGARVVDIEDPVGDHDAAARDGFGRKAAFDAVQAKLSFPLSAPQSVAGLPRRSLRTIRMDGRTGALATYGKGLGALMVLEAPVGDRRGGLAAGTAPGLQELSLDGTTAHELATALGTIVQFERDGVSYTVIGSVPPAAAEAAARAL